MGVVAVTNKAMSILTWLKFGTKNISSFKYDEEYDTLNSARILCHFCKSGLHVPQYYTVACTLLPCLYSCTVILAFVYTMTWEHSNFRRSGVECGHATKKIFLHIRCSHTSQRPTWGKVPLNVLFCLHVYALMHATMMTEITFPIMRRPLRKN